MNTAHRKNTHFTGFQNPKAGAGRAPSGGFLRPFSRCPVVSRILACGIFILLLAGLSGCSAERETMSAAVPVRGAGYKIAVWPVFNQSAAPAPLENIHRQLSANLRQRGIDLLDETILENVITRNRIRYLGGLDARTAEAFRREAGVPAVLITSLELYSETPPPKIALTARLVSTDRLPQVLWIDGVGMAGDDDLGLLELSLVEDPSVLLERALEHFANSLSEFLAGGKEWIDTRRARGKFSPKIIYNSPVFAPDLKYRVVVVPFFNDSQRKYAGDIMALHFVRLLRPLETFEVVEPGLVRHALLRMRIIMGDGLSLGDADVIFRRLNADLILTGRTLDYQDYQGLSGTPKVDFSAQLIERRSREIVWEIKSFNTGDDRVFFFDWGRVNTAYAMASEMVQLGVENLVE